MAHGACSECGNSVEECRCLTHEYKYVAATSFQVIVYDREGRVIDRAEAADLAIVSAWISKNYPTSKTRR